MGDAMLVLKTIDRLLQLLEWATEEGNEIEPRHIRDAMPEVVKANENWEAAGSEEGESENPDT